MFVRRRRWRGFCGSTFMWNNHTRGGYMETYYIGMFRKAKVSGNQKILLQHGVDSDIWPAVCVCVLMCVHPLAITPMNYYYYYLRTTKFDEPGTGAMSPEANFAKLIYIHVTIIIIYYTRNLCTVYAHTYDTPVCVLCVCAREYNT